MFKINEEILQQWLLVFFNKPTILKTLIAAKADLTIKNNEGKDAAALCEEREADECKAILAGK